MEVRLRLRLRDVCGRGAAALPATAGGLSWQPNRSVTRRTARIAREVYSVWYGRVGTTNYVPAEKVQQLFNDLQLYPSKSQVYEMLQCAKECAGRSSAAYLTFGEFCIFATELKRCYERGIPRPVQLSRLLERDGEEKKRRNRKMSKGIPKYEVFLGGSCNPTTWRQDVAIPTLKDLGITYYNPQVSHWGPELIELEYQAKQNATVLFFVIDNQTRSVASMIEAAHISGRRRKLILVIHPFQGPGQCIWGESITDEEFEDLMMGQMMLQDLVERQGIPVFESIPIALNCTAKVLRENLSVQDLGLQDYAQPVKMAHVQLGDKLIKLREAFDALDTSNSGEISIADVCMGFRVLTNRNLSNSEVRNLVANQTGLPGETHGIPLDQLHVNFEQFCAIVAEFKCGEKWTMSPQPLRSLQISTPQNGQNNCARDVYLGGTCQNTTWRDDIAIPILKKNGLTYFNPQQCRWSSRLIPIEAAAMDNSYVLLFVITNTSRSLASMAMAAHYIGLGCNVVLCVQHLPDDCIFGSDKLTKQAIKDYNRGRMYLSDLANREGVPVYESVAESVNCVIQKCHAR